MNAFNSTIRAWRPGKRSRATAAPSGRPINEASATASRLTRSERPTISTRSESSVAISQKAAPKAAEKSSTADLYHGRWLGRILGSWPG